MIGSAHGSGTGGFGDILVSSRSLDEYRAMFALTEEDVRRRILDCPGGAASFAAEVCARGGDVTACDVAYFADGLAAVATTAVEEAERGNRYVREHAGDYRWDYFADPEEHRRARCAAAELFAADARTAPHRYVAAALPELPFPDGGFDLVLSSHLLFSYADDLSYEFHRAAIIELMRVTSGQVRLFPLVPIGSEERYERLDDLIGDTTTLGWVSRLDEVDYEFQAGARELLIFERV
ncbi:methyltransferase domain-containing protein [Nocardia caishijiensis]|uniref:Methyltransferase type 11 domain-containing protein n=1 Tax=Nocardia caishijiensis TaxID=184756 RepID=A0ABQ6YML5_9NOCA|nr:methyltransferase domain-containing protein [Nocardia caishijiensis]KAF0847037.1 hypothetical protein FNL39_104459 [Nocardia caishijiensis]